MALGAAGRANGHNVLDITRVTVPAGEHVHADLMYGSMRADAGDLVLVHGLFEGPLVHPDWPEDQLAKWYEAPVAALSFEDNCSLVRIHPGGKPGAAAEVDLPNLGANREPL